MKVTVLGCGASWGVPAIGPDWGRCDPGRPAQPAAPRVRCWSKAAARSLLIDTSPDLRQQLLDAGVSRLDAVLLTHAHADHLHGIDDLRMVSQLMRQAIPFYAGAAGAGRGRAPLRLCLQAGDAGTPGLPAGLEPQRDRRPVHRRRHAGGAVRAEPRLRHDLGFRIGPVGYSTDVVELDDAAFAALAGVELWIVDCLRREPHPTHSHLAKTLAWIERVAAAPRGADPHGPEPRLSRAQGRIARRVSPAKTAWRSNCPIKKGLTRKGDVSFSIITNYATRLL